MISSKMVKKINHQMNREIYSSYLYLGMASYASEAGFNGVANWFNIQVQEELSHAQKFYNYINQQGERVLLEAIEAPPQDYKAIQDLFKDTLSHEKQVTSMINDLCALAVMEKDRATDIFLQWFVSEQVEEEANANDILQRLKIVGNDGNGQLMIDSELAARVFTPPPAE